MSRSEEDTPSTKTTPAFPSVLAPADVDIDGPPPDLTGFNGGDPETSPWSSRDHPKGSTKKAPKDTSVANSASAALEAALGGDVAAPAAEGEKKPEKKRPRPPAKSRAKPKATGNASLNADVGVESLKGQVLGSGQSAQGLDSAPGSPRDEKDNASNAGVEGEETATGPVLEHQSSDVQAQIAGGSVTGEAGPSGQPASIKKPSRSAAAKQKLRKKADSKGGTLFQYTSAFVPGSVYIQNPAGTFVQKDSNVDIIRQVSQARARLEKETAEAEKAANAEADPPVVPANPLNKILIIHPGSRNLRIGRASDYYPKEIPNCIARPKNAVNWGTPAPVPGSRVKRLAARAEEQREAKRRKKHDGEIAENGNGNGVNGHAGSNGQTDGDVDGAEGGGEKEDEADLKLELDVNGEWVNPTDNHIATLREYLKEHLRIRRLSTNFDEVRRIRAANARVKPENIPEHNDPYRIDWTEVEGRKFFVGQEALKLPPSAGFDVRYPILRRQFNTRDWASSQLLMDDIGLIILETLRTELDISPGDLPDLSLVLVVPDHGDRFHVQEMVQLLMGTMGFKEIAIHQESYTSIFCAGISTSCVVDVGATQTSITCVDEGLVVQDSRIMLNYGGDDVTAAFTALLERAAFPYKELDLANSQDWLLMDGLKIKMCTLEEHMVANTPWTFMVLRPVGTTQKYQLRTFDENILAPLSWFDTRMIDFEEKKGKGSFRFRGRTKGISDTLTSSYGEATSAMRECTKHLWIPKRASIATVPPANGEGSATAADEKPKGGARDADVAVDSAEIAAQFGSPMPAPDTTADNRGTNKPSATSATVKDAPTEPPTAAPSTSGTPAPEATVLSGAAPAIPPPGISDSTPPTVPQPQVPSTNVPALPELEMPEGLDVIKQASESALDGAISASISLAGTENKIKAAAGNILLVGGASGLKGLPAILSERLPHLLRSKGFNIDHVSIVPPPRNLNPAFVSWKGASVMCNLESLGDMWIRRDEWEALGAKAIKDRCTFL